MARRSGYAPRHLPPAEFGPTLRAARTAAGMSLRDVARALRASYGYVGMLERGERAPSTAVADALVEVLGMDAEAARIVRDAAVPGVGRSRFRANPMLWLGVMEHAAGGRPFV